MQCVKKKIYKDFHEIEFISHKIGHINARTYQCNFQKYLIYEVLITIDRQIHTVDCFYFSSVGLTHACASANSTN